MITVISHPAGFALGGVRDPRILLCKILGEVAEWLKAAVLKTVMDREVHLEFESLPLRSPTRQSLHVGASEKLAGRLSGMVLRSQTHKQFGEVDPLRQF